ncbi:hypothetical protein D3C72_1905560 [compost metagenome]
MAPQATRPQVDDLRAVLTDGDLEAQNEFGADHHRQLTDQHQPVFGHIAQIANGLVRVAVEDSQKVRQLMPLDSAVGKHVDIHYARLLSRAALLLRNGTA